MVQKFEANLCKSSPPTSTTQLNPWTDASKEKEKHQRSQAQSFSQRSFYVIRSHLCNHKPSHLVKLNQNSRGYSTQVNNMPSFTITRPYLVNMPYLHPLKQTWFTWKWGPLGKGDSYWKPSFPGSMLIFWGVVNNIEHANVKVSPNQPGYHGIITSNLSTGSVCLKLRNSIEVVGFRECTQYINPNRPLSDNEYGIYIHIDTICHCQIYIYMYINIYINIIS